MSKILPIFPLEVLLIGAHLARRRKRRSELTGMDAVVMPMVMVMQGLTGT